jgi:4-hydroxy-4-methyl-2-oxoglutarate aldolase
MELPGSDMAGLLDRMQEGLDTPVVSDALDRLGFRSQVMDARVRPMLPYPGALAGIAATLLFGPAGEVSDDPYAHQISAADALEKDAVAVLATGGLEGCAFWGELFSNAAIGRGARGAVMDGFHRDTRKIAESGFPVYSTGSRPIDIAGRARVIEWACPVECGGVRVVPGDVVFADADGVAVIPSAVVGEVVRAAFEKVALEGAAREELRAGMLIAEVWDRHRVL